MKPPPKRATTPRPGHHRLLRRGSDPPTFYFPIGDLQVYAGEDAPVALGLPGGLSHTFRVFQAQDIPTCENQDLELSWAVLADL